MATPLFRDKAISAIDSVERFDEAIVVISARSAAAFGALAALLAAVMVWSVTGRITVGVAGRGAIVAGAGVRPIVARSDGTVIALGKAGSTVARGEMIARLRTVAGEIVTVRSPIAGTLVEETHDLSSFVARGDTLATVEPVGASPGAVIFIPVETDRHVAAGMPVHLSPADARADIFGYVAGRVVEAAPYPASAARVKAALQNDAVASAFSPDVPVREVRVALDRDLRGALVWTGLRNGGRSVTPGTPCTATVVTGERRPITFVLPQNHE